MTVVRECRGPDPPPGWLPRPPRFEVKTPIKYRKTGETQWHEGVTENISGAGVFIRAVDPVPPKTAIEMIFSLFQRSSGQATTQVHCRGYIVREVPLTGAELGLAARITKYRLLRVHTAGK